MSQTEIKVKKRKGYVETLDLDKIHRMVENACEGLSGVSTSQVEMNSGVQFYDGITTEDIQEILIKSAADLITLDNPNYQFVAARLLLFSIRKSIFGENKQYPSLYEHIQKCVDNKMYSSEILEKYTKEELDILDCYINHDRDYLFTYAGLRQVVDKYLVQDRSTGKVFETPQFMYMLISAVGFSNYPKDTRLSYVKKYYDAISKHKLNVPTPILAGIRTPLKQSASCVLLDCGDSLESIIATDGAMMRYIAGKAGIGLNVGRLRALGSKIRNGEVISTGLIPFLKKFEGTLKSCHQGGVRAAMATVYVPIWHKEIEDVIVLKNNKGTDENRVRKLDYNVQLSRIFYERFIQNGNITLFCPNDVPGLYDVFGLPEFDDLYVKYESDKSIPRKTVKAQELISTLLQERFETGRNYLMNIDHCNSHGPFKDQVVMSNLCVAGETKIKIDCEPYIIEIKDLQSYLNKSNVKVLSYNIENNEPQMEKILAFAQTSTNAKVIKIKTNLGSEEITLTPEHKVFTNNRGYVMAKQLNLYDQLVFISEMESKTVGSIVAIEYPPDEIPVYDITVENTHNFFANGILVSNCTEIVEPTKPLEGLEDEDGAIALCTLSAFNVGLIKSNDELEELSELVVRYLEELIESQHYLVKAAEISTRKRRMLGIGVIGFAHYLAKVGYFYDQPEAWSVAHILAESIQYYLLKASNKLAREKGACDGFSLTKYSEGILPIDTYKKEVDNICKVSLHHDWETLRQDIVKYGLRHSTLSTIMPSASSSILSNATSSIEAPKGLISIKKSKKGPVKQVVPQYSSLKSKYTLRSSLKTNTPYFNIVAMFQKFFDHSISTDWDYNPENYPNKEVPTSVLVGDALYAYSVGHKTAYYSNVYDGRNDEDKDKEKEEDSYDKNRSLLKLIEEITQSEGEEHCESCTI